MHYGVSHGNDMMQEPDDKATEIIRSFKLVHNTAD